MLGWNIRVYRQVQDRLGPSAVADPQGERVAIWQAGLWGQKWIDALVESGAAIKLKGGAYPNVFTAPSRLVIAQIRAGIPDVNDSWIAGPHDILGSGWDGKTVIHEDVIARCDPEEWLIVESWDES
jgi:hypothetical protein